MLIVLLAFAGPVEDLNGSLAAAARAQAVSATAKPIRVKAVGFDGTVTAVEPGKNLTIDVVKFQLADDAVSGRFGGGGVFDLDGKMKIGETPTDVKTRVRVKATASGRAAVSFAGTDFVVTPSVEDVELVELEVLSFEPDVLPGGNELMGGVVKGLFKANKADVTKQIAAALGPVKLPRLAAVTGPAAAGENPVLRRYAASVILSELVQHGTPGTGLSVEQQTDAAFVARGTAWLEQPTKWTRVAVTRLAVRDGVVYVGGRITGPFSGMARFELPAVSLESAFGGVLSGEIEGDVQFKDGKLGGGNVYVLSASVSDFQAAALPVRLAAAAAQNMLNRVAAVKAAEFRPKIEAALGGPRRERLVTAAYRVALGRAADDADAAAAALADISPRDLLGRLLGSPEWHAKAVKGQPAADVVVAVYRATLRREPKADEVREQMTFLAGSETVYEPRRVRLRTVMVAVGQRPRTYRDLVTALLTGAEYRTKFGAGLPSEGSDR